MKKDSITPSTIDELKNHLTNQINDFIANVNSKEIIGNMIIEHVRELQKIEDTHANDLTSNLITEKDEIAQCYIDEKNIPPKNVFVDKNSKDCFRFRIKKTGENYDFTSLNSMITITSKYCFSTGESAQKYGERMFRRLQKGKISFYF